MRPRKESTEADVLYAFTLVLASGKRWYPNARVSL